MNKKILIGSIIAICILIGGSFTSVVGYRSRISDVKASPLFNIRTSRAIDEESEGLRCKYVGKGEEITISIPKRDSRLKLIQKIMNIIQKMDENEIKRLKDNLINIINEKKLSLQQDSDIDFDVIKQLNNTENMEPQIRSVKFWKCITYWEPITECIKGMLVVLFLLYPIIGFIAITEIIITILGIFFGSLWILFTIAMQCDLTIGPMSACANTHCGC